MSALSALLAACLAAPAAADTLRIASPASGSTVSGMANVTFSTFSTASPIADPTAQAGCSGSSSVVTVRWQDAGRGSKGYYVDLSPTGDWTGGFWNRLLPSSSLSVSGPAGFSPYHGASGALTLSPGARYYARVYYIAADQHSAAVSFSAASCAAPPPAPPPPALPALTAPVVSAACSNSAAAAAVSWQEAGRGALGYMVDVTDQPSFAGAFWNKKIPVGTLATSAPSGFGPYNGASGALTLRAGATYLTRIYYPKTQEHSPTASFKAPDCAPPPPTPPSPPPAPVLPALAAPSFSASCVNGAAVAQLSWSEAGRGKYGYIVDLADQPTFDAGFWNKTLPAGTLATTAPAGFLIAGASGPLTLRAGATYRARVFYGQTNERSPVASLVAPSCAAAPPPAPPLPTPASCVAKSAVDFACSLKTETLPNGQTTRTFNVHVPKSYVPGKPAPVVLVFHQWGGSADGIAALSGMNAKSDAAGFIAVYPQGWSYRTDVPWQNSFNNKHHCCGDALKYGIDDVLFTNRMLDFVQQHYTIDAKRVYSTGFSNGGYFSHLLACSLSGRVAAIASTGAWDDQPTCAPGRAVPVQIHIGTADNTMPVSSADSTALNWAGRDGLVKNKLWLSTKDGRTCYGYTKTGTTAAVPMVEECVYAGATHAWLAGEADLMWAFFANHPMP